MILVTPPGAFVDVSLRKEQGDKGFINRHSGRNMTIVPVLIPTYT